MKKRWTVLVLAAGIALVWALALRAGEEADSSRVGKYRYVGSKKCKMCHLDEYKVWSAGKMAATFAALPDSSARDPRCLKCHATGFDNGGYAIGGANVPDLTSVQCEACHGPGSGYESVMKDKAKMIEAGLITSDEKLCLTCHHKECPNFKEFDFATMKDKVHPLPKK